MSGEVQVEGSSGPDGSAAGDVVFVVYAWAGEHWKLDTGVT